MNMNVFACDDSLYTYTLILHKTRIRLSIIPCSRSRGRFVHVRMMSDFVVGNNTTTVFDQTIVS